MPFRLTNAPMTFNRLMTDIFCKHLDDFILVFFDDILVQRMNVNTRSMYDEYWNYCARTIFMPRRVNVLSLLMRRRLLGLYNFKRWSFHQSIKGQGSD